MQPRESLALSPAVGFFSKLTLHLSLLLLSCEQDFADAFSLNPVYSRECLGRDSLCSLSFLGSLGFLSCIFVLGDYIGQGSLWRGQAAKCQRECEEILSWTMQSKKRRGHLGLLVLRLP